MKVWLMLVPMLSVACSQEYDVVVRNADAFPEASTVEVAIVSSCEAQSVTGRIDGRAVLRFAVAGASSPLGDVAPGQYGLFARLVDGDCQVVAAGCASVDLEARGSGRLEVQVEAAAGSQCEVGESCLEGRCENAAIDAGVDVAAEGECADCQSDNPCVEARCENGTCTLRDLSNVSCPGGQCYFGECCRGCWDGRVCQEGTDATSCGLAGFECQSCDCPTPTCTAGTCGEQPAFANVSIGARTGCFILASGALYCAGENHRFQLARRSPPSVVSDPTRIGSSFGWTSVAVGAAHVCGIRDGGLFCWGNNFSGQAGTLEGGPIEAPRRIDEEGYVRVLTYSVANHNLAERVDGVWVGFGSNESGILDPARPTTRLSPAPIFTIEGDPWRQVDPGRVHACGLTMSGAIYCWGRNDEGQVGLEPSATVELPNRISDETDWTAIFAGRNQSCAVNAVGEIWCLGSAREFTNGRDDDDPLHELRRISSLQTSEVFFGDLASCARASMEGEEVYGCWGPRSDADWGDGIESEPLPAAIVPHLEGTTRMAMGIRAGYRYQNGTNLVWGRNRVDEGSPGSGRLALGETNDVSVPAELCIPER
ncbi:MAG: hypothetical protein AAF411_02560 [Myxococcota bacterium]